MYLLLKRDAFSPRHKFGFEAASFFAGLLPAVN
jgi:hypothetical protein